MALIKLDNEHFGDMLASQFEFWIYAIACIHATQTDKQVLATPGDNSIDHTVRAVLLYPGP